MSHVCECVPSDALSRTRRVPTRTTAPTQSHTDQDARQRRPGSLVQSMTPTASANTTGITDSSPRTSGATSEAATAAAIQRLLRDTSALAIRKKQSAAYG